MAEAIDKVVALLKSKDYASVIDQVVADEQLAQQLKSKVDAINAEVVPFILKNGSFKNAKALALFCNPTLFSSIIKGANAFTVLLYILKHGTDDPSIITIIEPFAKFIEKEIPIEARYEIFSNGIYAQIKVCLLSNEDLKRLAAQRLLAAAIKDSQQGALKVVEDIDVLNAVWDLIERDKLMPGTVTSDVLNILLTSENMPESLGVFLASKNMGAYFLRKLFPVDKQGKPSAEITRLGYASFMGNIMRSFFFYSHYVKKDPQFIDNLVSKAFVVMTQNPERKIQLEAARYIRTVSYRENEELTLHTPIFFEFVKWIASGNEELYQAAILYLRAITFTSQKARLVLLQHRYVVWIILNHLPVTETSPIVSNDLSFLVNLALHPDCKSYFNIEAIEAKMATIITNQAKFDEAEVTNAFKVLTLVGDADKTSTIKLDEKVVSLQIAILKQVLAGQAKLKKKFSLVGAMLPWPNFSVNDANKELLGRLGIIEPLLTLAQLTSSNDYMIAPHLKKARGDACKVLWNLAFTKENRKRIEDAKGIEVLKKLATDPHNDPELIENAKGALWMFEIKVETPVTHTQPTVQQQIAAATAATASAAHVPHIMISYNWGVQPTVLKLASALKAAGFHIWLDVEQMAGSTLEAMADAIERSALVLVCMTEKYKDSPNCRLEGQYCSSLRKPFIPLLMQERYQPNGWLGILLGARLYHDFSSESNWETRVAQLVKEIGDRGKLGDVATAVVPVAASSSSSSTAATPARPNIENWEIPQVAEWLKKSKLGSLDAIFEKQKLNGVCLKELALLSKDFYAFSNYVRDNIGISSPGEILQLFHHLKKLPA